MTAIQGRTTLSHTRGVPLGNLTGLCFALGESAHPLSVTALATEGSNRGIFAMPTPAPGGRLPTRINHHMIALRELELVGSVPEGGHVYYCLTALGRSLCKAATSAYARQGNEGPLVLDHPLRETWRPVLSSSEYVREHWLKYFMTSSDFSYDQLTSLGGSVTILRVPSAERHDEDDSGYRLLSDGWPALVMDSLERREIYEGLRRWTNEAYLTDDRVPDEIRAPFAYVQQSDDAGIFEIEAHVVRAWLEPEVDLDRFETMVHESLDEQGQGNRITLPALIIDLSDKYSFAKENIKSMLVELHYQRGNHFFFERGSEFLIRHSFDVARPEDYYLKLVGVWRTSLIRH